MSDRTSPRRRAQQQHRTEQRLTMREARRQQREDEAAGRFENVVDLRRPWWGGAQT